MKNIGPFEVFVITLFVVIIFVMAMVVATTTARRDIANQCATIGRVVIDGVALECRLMETVSRE